MAKVMLAIFMGLGFCGNLTAQEQPAVFHPVALWEPTADRGAILVGPMEILVMDSKGQKHGRITANEPINGAYFSPDGKKLIYTTISNIWLVHLDTNNRYLVSAGQCEFLKWNSDGSGFVFAVKNSFFWADGDGKNVKQVYP